MQCLVNESIFVIFVYSGEIHSGTVVTYNDKEEILCQNCSPDITLSDHSPTDLKSPSPTTYNSTAEPISQSKEHSPPTSSITNRNTSKLTSCIMFN